MENNFDNTPENMGENTAPEENTPRTDEGAGGQNTDPNSGAQYTYTDPNAGYEQNTSYSQNYNQNYNQNYAQDNYNYNVGNNTGYNRNYDTGMDQSPMSMGDWLLTILIMTFIPCVGIILYFVWAFGKNGNINRRNYCRAYLIIMGIALALALIVMIIVGVSSIGSLRYYY